MFTLAQELRFNFCVITHKTMETSIKQSFLV